MDLFAAFVIFILVVFICSVCRMCCRKRTSDGMVITTAPVTITSEVHRVATGAQAVPSGVVIQGHPTGTAVLPPLTVPYPHMPAPYPPMPAAYPGHQPYPAQPYPVAQQYPIQSAAHLPPQTVQFPALPSTMMGEPQLASASVPSGSPMSNPPSYDQVMTNAYAPQAPYNPDYKGQ